MGLARNIRNDFPNYGNKMLDLNAFALFAAVAHAGSFSEAARRLGVKPGRAAVIEDAASGIQAGKAGHFGLVVGISRNGFRDLLQHC